MGTFISLRKYALTAFTLPLVAFLGPLYAAEWARVLEKEDVVILYGKSMRVAAENTAEIYPAIKKGLEKTFQWKIDFRPTVYLVKRKDEFQEMAGTDIIVAFALPSKKLIVMDYSRIKIHPFSIEATLKHELCHLLLHEHIPEENFPMWLDEGLAQWVSGGISEVIMHRKRSLLKEAILAGRYVPLRGLINRFEMEKTSLLLAYEASKDLVEYIINTHGKKKLIMFLDYLEQGYTPETALERALAISQGSLETAWHADLRKRFTWAHFLIDHLYELLFFAAALIVAYGFFKALIRKRAYMREMEDE